MENEKKHDDQIIIQGLHPKIIKEGNKDYGNYLVYKSILDEALKKSDIKNIAITGVYGSGKSSLWKTYANENKENLKSITVSLGEFSGDKKIEDDEINQIEIKIINQILYQIDNKAISKSSLNIKLPESNMSLIKKILCLSLFIFSIFFIFDQDLRRTQFLTNNKFLSSIFSYYVFLTVLLSWGIHRIINAGDFKFNKINIKGAEIESKQKPGDILNQNIVELVYLIHKDKVDVIVFEDLDRFKNVDLFTNFRELNFLINQQNKKTVRFIYMVKDGLFKDKNRAKFFDYIIPVMPVISQNNSREKALNLFSKLPSYKSPSEKSIKKISLYIDDMRVLNSIFNEYQVFLEIIQADIQQLENDKLLAMITLKNLFPKEFDQMQYNKGYIASLFAKKKQHINTLVIKKETELQNSIDKYKYLNEISKEITLAMPSNISFEYENDSTFNVIKDWIENPGTKKNIKKYSYPKRSINFNDFISEINKNLDNTDKFNYEDIINREQIIEEEEARVTKLNNEIKRIRTYSIKELLNEHHLFEIDDFFNHAFSEESDVKDKLYTEFELKEDHFRSIITSRYYPFIRFSLIEGYIDENFLEYIHRFYHGGLSTDGIKYINSVNAMMSTDPTILIKDPKSVLEELSSADLSKPGALNFSILDYLIDNQKYTEMFSMMSSITLFEKFELWESYLSSIEYKKLLRLVNEMLLNEYDVLISLVNHEYADIRNKYTLSVAFFTSLQDHKTNSTLETINNFVINNPKIILQMEKQLNIDEKSLFWENLLKQCIKFEDLNNINISEDSAHNIWDRKLFRVNVTNSTTLISIMEKSKYEQIESSLFDHIFNQYSLNDEHFISLLEEYSTDLINGKFDLFISEENTLKKVLNHSLDLKYKEAWIEKSNVIISEINLLDKTLWDNLFKYNKLKISSENIMYYWNTLHTLSEHFIEWINNNLFLKDIELSEDLAEYILKNNQLNSDILLYSLAIKSASSEYQLEEINKEIKDEKIELLIDANKLSFSKDNFIYVQDNCPKQSFVNFIINNKTHLISYIKSYKKDKIIEERNVYILINECEFNTDELKSILDSFNSPISLFKIKNFNHDVFLHILEYYFDFDDTNKIVELDNNFELWPEFIQKVNNQTEFKNKVLNQIQSKDNLSKFIINDLSSEELKIEVLTMVLDTEDRLDNKILLILTENISVLRDLHTVFNGNRPTMRNEHQEKVANILENKEYISFSKKTRQLYLLKNSN